jgi:hypothetical protein
MLFILKLKLSWIDQPRGGRMNIPYKNGDFSDIVFMKTV